MIVQDQPDMGRRWVAAVQFLEEGNKLTTAMPVYDDAVNLAAEQIDPGHQRHGSMADIS